MTTISRLLVANRGEIARRVFATCRRLGIETVAVHSDADAGSAVRARGRPGRARCRATRRPTPTCGPTCWSRPRAAPGADAVHPGYGFLSESADFARAVEAAGLVWVGPIAGVDRAMGSKIEAKRIMAAAGVPVLRGAGRADRGGPPAAGQGLRRGRRPRHADRAHPRRPARRDREGLGRGGVRVRRRHRLRRAVRRGGPARRGPGARSPRRRPGARRARLLDPAPAPEGGRGGAGAAAAGRSPGPRCTRRPGPPRPAIDYRGAGTVEFLYDVDKDSLLLPGDEHPPPGRAPGHRAGLRRRPRRPPARRGGGPVPRRARGRARCSGTPSRCGSTPRTPPPTGSRRAGCSPRSTSRA